MDSWQCAGLGSVFLRLPRTPSCPVMRLPQILQPKPNLPPTPCPLPSALGMPFLPIIHAHSLLFTCHGCLPSLSCCHQPSQSMSLSYLYPLCPLLHGAFVPTVSMRPRFIFLSILLSCHHLHAASLGFSTPTKRKWSFLCSLCPSLPYNLLILHDSNLSPLEARHYAQVHSEPLGLRRDEMDPGPQGRSHVGGRGTELEGERQGDGQRLWGEIRSQHWTDKDRGGQGERDQQ